MDAIFADRRQKGYVVPYPPTPAETCHCILPDVRRGTNLYFAWGEERCAQCGNHRQWGHGV